ncbi:hypothetical protein ZIOFF_020682 [Zingiber officinale]|uniref:Uncharacterized protein n=1 Tax=Zingiber officinale TaxID=94328 RepID=A0A8J5H8E9_ZINOF|nr:hypothetical protein ZIOFF_020682 [Zingiber officinale]
MLLLRVAAAAITGAAALLSVRRYHRERAIYALRRELRDALLLLDDSPAVLVAGFRAHGKSSFVNTACRVLSAESGPLILRAQTAPGGGATPEQRRVVRAPVARPPDGAAGEEEEDDEDGAVVDLIDAPPFPEPRRLTDADVEAALTGAPTAECVVLVLRCGGSSKHRHVAVKKLAEVANAIRQRGRSQIDRTMTRISPVRFNFDLGFREKETDKEQILKYAPDILFTIGLQFVVVLTRKNNLKSKREASELRQKIIAQVQINCVYFLENYVVDEMLNFKIPWSMNNQFETHFTTLVIMRQCVEFIKVHRCNNSRIM